MDKDIRSFRILSDQWQRAGTVGTGNVLRRFGVSGEGRFRPTRWRQVLHVR